ncbi:acyl-CoA dehydrogenase family protein [Perlucidibaca piscinae]|uniref:acyl-CoA dehydrogenase family protein n=1 Tax=Perlucidibaca piscinae TaxID=392589 RepID=UPI0003B7088B|nr:acyl-CoA dehydrogenase family protein [Perlucidibaca piscinae]
MNLEFTDEEIAFRNMVRAWMKENVSDDLRSVTARGDMTSKDQQQRWEKQLGDKGWLALTWPEQYGGPGWTATQRYIFDLERAMAGAPPTSPFGVSMVGPVIYTFGSEAQKQRWLPGIVKGDTLWCQGYSEPNAGSDLASLKTRAERKDDHYLVNGQKIWTTQAHWADMIFCLVRTDSTVKQQQGISFLLIDMKTPGIEVRPIYTIDGHHHLNEVYFSDVQVPLENLVGTEGMGWTIAKFLLTHERTTIAGVADSHHAMARLKEALHAAPRFAVPAQARRRIAELEIELMALEYTNFRTVAATDEGRPFGPESSGLKIKGTELQQKLSQTMVELGGLMSLVWDSEEPVGSDQFNNSPRRYNFLRASTIYGGSNEIQKNVLAKMLLGL